MEDFSQDYHANGFRSAHNDEEGSLSVSASDIRGLDRNGGRGKDDESHDSHNDMNFS